MSKTSQPWMWLGMVVTAILGYLTIPALLRLFR